MARFICLALYLIRHLYKPGPLLKGQFTLCMMTDILPHGKNISPHGHTGNNCTPHCPLVQQAMHTSELLLPQSILSHRLFNQVHGVLDFQMSFNYGQDINGRASVYIYLPPLVFICLPIEPTGVFYQNRACPCERTASKICLSMYQGTVDTRDA